LSMNLASVLRAEKRAAASVHEDMRIGLTSLATIASTALFVGVFGTVIGITASFVGCTPCQKEAGMDATVVRVSEALWPTAAGLLIGLMSFWFYKYLAGRLADFDLEMDNVAVDVVNQLARHRGVWELTPAFEPVPVEAILKE